MRQGNTKRGQEAKTTRYRKATCLDTHATCALSQSSANHSARTSIDIWEVGMDEEQLCQFGENYAVLCGLERENIEIIGYSSKRKRKNDELLTPSPAEEINTYSIFKGAEDCTVRPIETAITVLSTSVRQPGQPPDIEPLINPIRTGQGEPAINSQCRCICFSNRSACEVFNSYLYSKRQQSSRLQTKSLP